MLGHFGFSYIGLIFLLMLIIPNILWAKSLPQGEDAGGESKVLGCFERVGQVFVTCTLLTFSDFHLQGWSLWLLWLIAAIALMVMYECWWIRYFQSERTKACFYSSFLGIPVAGAALPVMAFVCLGIYGKVIWLILAAVIFGVGHIGIHLDHRRKAMGERA